jgi:hypothetical protein
MADEPTTSDDREPGRAPGGTASRPGVPARSRLDPRGWSPLALGLVVLGLCLLVDVPLILYNAFGERPIPVFWRLGPEWSVSSMFGHVKMLLAALLLLLAARASGLPAYRAWALGFAIILVEDTFEVHDRGGRILARALGVSGAGPRTMVEAAIMVAVGLVILGLIVWAWRSTRDEGLRRYTRQAFALLVLLAVFVVGVDSLHFVTEGRIWRLRWLLEEGGELVTMSLILAHAVWHVAGVRAAASRPHEAPPDAPG